MEDVCVNENHYKKLFDKSNEYYSGDRSDMLQFVPLSAKRTLDFGCGQGSFSLLLKEQRGAEAWGVELYQPAATIAASKLDHVLCMDAIQAITKLPDCYFDCILFLDILEHLVDPFRLLNECRDKLAPGGVLVASIPNVRYYRTFSKYVFHGNWEYRDQGILDIGHLRFFTYKSIRLMVERTGYSLKKIKGMHPTGSKNFFILNSIFLNRLWDARYMHFAVVAEKGER